MVCDPASNAGCDPRSATPRCEENACVACSDDAFCGALPLARGGFCTGDGRCGPCDPDDNEGCGGITPICDDTGLQCRRCRADADCEFGNRSPTGICVVCDPDDPIACVQNPDGSPALPVCIDGRCVPCQDDSQCAGHPYGNVCDPVDGRCACRADGMRCALDSDRPICQRGACVGCARDEDCGGNLFGARCDRATGTCMP